MTGARMRARAVILAVLVCGLGFIGAGYLIGVAFPFPDREEPRMNDRLRAVVELPPPGPAYTYAADVLRVIDGDTLEVRVDLGFRVYVVERIRLRGVDAPERNTSAGRVAVAGMSLILDRLSDGRQYPRVVLVTHRGTRGGAERSFDRYVADVFIGGVDLAAELVDAGHAVRADP